MSIAPIAPPLFRINSGFWSASMASLTRLVPLSLLSPTQGRLSAVPYHTGLGREHGLGSSATGVPRAASHSCLSHTPHFTASSFLEPCCSTIARLSCIFSVICLMLWTSEELCRQSRGDCVLHSLAYSASRCEGRLAFPTPNRTGVEYPRTTNTSVRGQLSWHACPFPARCPEAVTQ